MNSEFSERLSLIERALDEALPSPTNRHWRDGSFGDLSSCIQENHFTHLTIPCRALINLGGKRWRPLLLVLMAELARNATDSQGGASTALSESDTYKITPLVEFVHTASLIHDDIEDSADMRRGKPAAHITYGIDQALNAASWLYFEAPACIEALPLPADEKAVYYELYTRELRRLHLGQAMDISWHSAPENFPTTDEYFSMTKCKTGTLASLAAQTGILAGGGNKSLAAEAGAIAAEIGIGFQILDDVQNLTTGNPGKQCGDDIVEGKKSLPVLLHTEKYPDDRQKISEYFASARRGGIGDEAVEKCIALLSESKAIEKAKEHGITLITEKSKQLSTICGAKNAAAPLVEKLFAQLAAPLSAKLAAPSGDAAATASSASHAAQLSTPQAVPLSAPTNGNSEAKNA